MTSYASIVGKSDQWNQLKSAIHKRISRVSNDSPPIITRSEAARACRSHCNLIQRRRRRWSDERQVRSQWRQSRNNPDIEYRAISEPGRSSSARTETHFLVTADTRYVDLDDHRWLYHRLAGCLRHDDVHSLAALRSRSDPISDRTYGSCGNTIDNSVADHQQPIALDAWTLLDDCTGLHADA